ncbi:MAG: DUF3488 and transglutaminase-like domain-containing protein [Oscillospiraceae bacterium]|nr:DUF3488 and transglutaminase-like domain-containing protein [Oscillospiraceae bacterium]
MELRLIYEKYVLRFLGTLCLCAALVLYLSTMSDTDLNSVILIFAVLIFAAFFVIFDFWVKNPLFYILLILLSVYVAVIVSVSLISQLLLLFSVVGFVFKLLDFRYVRLAAGAGLLLFCVVMAVLERNAEFAVILFIFTFIFCVLHEWVIALKSVKVLSHLLVFMLLAGFVSAVLPSKQEPIQWTLVRSIISGVQNAAKTLGERITLAFDSTGYEFRVNITGYSDTGNLGGSLAVSETPVLRITNFFGAGERVYLTGSIMDNYTGSEWTRKNNFSGLVTSEHRLDFMELISAFHQGGVFDMDEELRDEIFIVREIGIDYLNIRTRSVFYPLKLLNLSIPTPLGSDTVGSSMFFDRIAGEGVGYRVKYVDLNLTNELLVNLLEDGVHAAYELSPAALLTLINENFPGVRFGGIPEDYAELLEARREAILEAYTALPDTVPERVHDLALEITSGFGNDYAKMRAIERYLSQNYAYTRTPPVVTGEDFVDAFLFELGEGYCTYFATAAAVLGRAAGIPTRYVQGYAATAQTSELFKRWNIRQSNAHAWVEAYIGGVGWIAFEPSPALSGTRYGEWSGGRGSGASGVPGASSSAATASALNPAPTDSPGQDSPEADNAQQRSFFLIVLAVGGAVVLIAGLTILAGICILIRRMKKAYGKAPPSERLLSDYKAILLLLELSGKKPLEGETMRQFAVRVSEKEFSEVTHIFEQVRYGGYEIDSHDAEKAAALKEKLFRQTEKGLKQRLGRVKYYLELTKFRS